jgi:hypothetical protein
MNCTNRALLAILAFEVGLLIAFEIVYHQLSGRWL